MMNAQFLIDAFKESSNNLAIVWNGKEVKYGGLLKAIQQANDFLSENQILSGQVIALKGDFTPNTISLLIALINNRNIIVPFNNPMKDSEEVKFEIAKVQKTISVNLDTDQCKVENTGFDGDHEYYTSLRNLGVSGLVLFSSGTSGFPKAAVHNFQKLLKKFKTSRKSLRTINFLLFDHWGGLNTLLHTLSNCGVVLALYNRKPDFVCKFVQENKVELLPVSPSFLNLMILSETYKKYDLSSLKLISYGTEPMPETTLKRAKGLFPNVKFQQTYGLIELGVLRSKSKSDDSLWVKLGGEGYDLRVVDNMLQIKAESAILGYLNASSPFTEDGYFITGDQVEVDGEYYKILGRKSELINVGGDKVYPQEVENVILQMDNVMEVTIFGQKHAIMGNIVCAKVLLKEKEDKKVFSRRLKEFCKGKLQSFKVPVKIENEEEVLHSHRFKKTRKFD
ncbi:ANL family adenylate-forming protein [Aquimarina megaterium]|uniref:ANL family adenylate-forming protein n=1 Tax=Aquimarina megaterium TaxID=1443666 RepID=UPI0004ADA019|nr:fatty acid--CoA ligase family protein [Aquimarina megaterium]